MTVGNALKQGIFVVGAKRTPFGTFGGTLKAWSPTDLQASISRTSVTLIVTLGVGRDRGKPRINSCLELLMVLQ